MIYMMLLQLFSNMRVYNYGTSGRGVSASYPLGASEAEPGVLDTNILKAERSESLKEETEASQDRHGVPLC